jgi:hypothetical protein
MFGISKAARPAGQQGQKTREPAQKRPAAKSAAMVDVTFKLLPAQRDKLTRLGGAQWLRERIDQAPDPDAASE